MPTGLIKIGFSNLKQKLLGSIVAITAVYVLEWFMDIDQRPDTIKPLGRRHINRLRCRHASASDCRPLEQWR